MALRIKAIISRHSTIELIFTTELKRVYSAVRTESLNINQFNIRIQGLSNENSVEL